jgi:anti-sigma factor RsiW
MNCGDIEELAPLYFSGELGPAQAERFAAHLQHCRACGRDLEQDSALRQLLRKDILAKDIDTSSLDRRVRNGIASDRHRAGWLRRMVPAAGIAALLLAGVTIYRAKLSGHTSPVYAAAARDHRTEIVYRKPRRWLTDRASLERLAEGQGMPGSRLVAFQPAGYRLMQGKLCILDGRIFLHLVYTNNAGQFSLFLRHEAAQGWSRAIQKDSFASEQVAGFQHDGTLALVVSEDTAETVLNLARAAEASL